MAKNGLILSYYFPPSGGAGVQRWTKYIKYLSKQDWQFTVITSAIPDISFKDTGMLNELPKNVKIIRVGTPDLSHKFSIKHKESNYLLRWLAAFYYIYDSRVSWNKAALEAAHNEIGKQKFDVIFCTVPPYSLAEVAVELTKKYNNIPVVLDMRDAWSINPLKIHPTFLHRIKDRNKEISLMKEINNFVFIADFIPDLYKDIIPGFDKMTYKVIPNGFDESDFNFSQPGVQIDTQFFNIAYSGTFYSHLNHPGNLFKALYSLKNDGIKNIRFHHIGKSALDVKKLARKYSIDDQVQAWGYLEHEECLSLLNQMNAFVMILDERNKNASYTIGSKIYEYLRLKKPILGMVPAKCEAAHIIDVTDSGIVCSGYNQSQIKTAIAQIMKNENQFTFDKISVYSREAQAMKLLEFLDNDVLKRAL